MIQHYKSLQSNLIIENTKISYLLATLAGGISAFALAPYFLLPVLFLTFPLFYFLIINSKSKRQAFFVGFGFGLGHFTIGLYWIANALFFDIGQFWFLLPFALLGIPALIAFLYTAPFSLIIYSLKIHNDYSRIILFSVIWVIFEWLRAHLFTGFPWNLIGYSLCFSEYQMQLSAITGIYGLSLLVVVTATLSYKRNLPAILVITLIYGASHLYGYIHIKTSGLENIKETNLRIVQANIKQELRWDKSRLAANFQKYIRLSKQQSRKTPDIIIWPEGALEAYIDTNETIPIFHEFFPGTTRLITGSVRMKQSLHDVDLWVSALVINNDGEVTDYYDKMHLVPFGEYVPLRFILSFNKITKGFKDYIRGNKANSIAIGDNFPSFSPIICYEVIFPDAETLKNSGSAKWILNLTTDSWYGDTSGPQQHFHKARIRAIEQGMPLVRSAGTGISAVIDSFGRVEAKLAINQEGVIDHLLPRPILNKTFYHKYGDAAIGVILLLLSTLAALITRRPN